MTSVCGPRALADGLVAGAVAGLVSGAPSTAIALARGHDPLEAAAAAGTLLVLPTATRTTRLAAGAVVHTMLSLAWGVALAVVLPRRRAMAAGAVAGLGIAALDLGVIGRHHPAIRRLATGPQVLDHLAFGAVAGGVLAVRRRHRD